MSTTRHSRRVAAHATRVYAALIDPAAITAWKVVRGMPAEVNEFVACAGRQPARLEPGARLAGGAGRTRRPMRLAGALLATILLWPAAGALADRWLPPRSMQAVSPGGQFQARITPRGSEPSMLSLWGLRPARRKLYEVPVVNSRSPVAIAVSDGGHVLTVDEWGRMGDKHAAVLYDPAGRVVVDHDLTDLLTADEIEKRVQRTVSSRRWRYVLEQPSSDDQTFHITTNFGLGLHVALSDGSIRREAGSFVRLQRYLSGERPCARPRIDLLHVVWPGGDAPHRAVTCQLRPEGGTCHDGAKGFSRPTRRRKLDVRPAAFRSLLAPMFPLFVGGVGGEWKASVLHLELTFDCSSTEADRYVFAVDRCQVKDTGAQQALAALLTVTGLSERVRCDPPAP